MAVPGRWHLLGSPQQPVRSLPNPRIIQSRPTKKCDPVSSLVVRQCMSKTAGRCICRDPYIPIGPRPRPGIVRRTSTEITAEENYFLPLLIIRHPQANCPRRGTRDWAAAKPVRPVPDPCVVEVISGIEAAENDGLLSDRVVRHPVQKARKWLIRRKSAGPLIAIPNPRIVQPRGGVLRTAKHHHLLSGFVVSH